MIEDKEIFKRGEKEKDAGQKIFALVREKFNACRGVVTEQFNVTNVYKISEYLYYSLYDPKKFDSFELPENPDFPKRTENLRALLPSHPVDIPEKDGFIKKIRHAMTQETEFDKILYPNAIENLKQIAELGPIFLWTKGDSRGLKIDGESIPGSAEQVKKMARAGINELRRKIADDTGKRKNEIIRVVADEDKKKQIPQILDYFQGKGITKAFVFEDTLKNLKVFEEKARKKEDIEAIPVWIKHGLQKSESQEGLIGYIAVDSLDDAVQKIKEQIGDSELVGFVVDYDGVVADDKKKRKIQEETILRVLKEKKWIEV